ncbi:MAG: DinB family protein [Cyclobacteriaceae bacterium]
MTKPELASRLKSQYEQFADCITGLSDEQFVATPTGKWSAGQHAEHLLKSVAPLNKVMQSRPVLESFGRAEHSSRDYDAIVVYYQETLAKGYEDRPQFLPAEVTAEQRAGLINKLLAEVDTLCELLTGYSEEDLDQLVIPHPLLGNLTIREMMLFTAYHGYHHELGVRKIFE